MEAVILTVHLIVALALIGLVLLQPSEGGALGMGQGQGGLSGLMTGRSAAGALSRTTVTLAALFFATSIALTLIAKASRAPAPLAPTARPGDAPLLPVLPGSVPSVPTPAPTGSATLPAPSGTQPPATAPAAAPGSIAPAPTDSPPSAPAPASPTPATPPGR